MIVCALTDWLALARSLAHSLASVSPWTHCVSVNACNFSCMSFFGAASCLRLSGSTVVFFLILFCWIYCCWEFGLFVSLMLCVVCVLGQLCFFSFLVMLLQIFAWKLLCKAIHKRNDQDWSYQLEPWTRTEFSMTMLWRKRDSFYDFDLRGEKLTFPFAIQWVSTHKWNRRRFFFLLF